MSFSAEEKPALDLAKVVAECAKDLCTELIKMCMDKKKIRGDNEKRK